MSKYYVLKNIWLLIFNHKMVILASTIKLHYRIFLWCKLQVKHSQSLTVTPTYPWITVQEDGMVVMAHCTCKAGLGEVCSECQRFVKMLHNRETHESNPKKCHPLCHWGPLPQLRKVRLSDLDSISNLYSFLHIIPSLVSRKLLSHFSCIKRFQKCVYTRVFWDTYEKY